LNVATGEAIKRRSRASRNPWKSFRIEAAPDGAGEALFSRMMPRPPLPGRSAL
jgi:hypothetical protein